MRGALRVTFVAFMCVIAIVSLSWVVNEVTPTQVQVETEPINWQEVVSPKLYALTTGQRAVSETEVNLFTEDIVFSELVKNNRFQIELAVLRLSEYENTAFHIEDPGRTIQL